MLKFATGHIIVGDHPHPIATHFGYLVVHIVPTQPNSALIIVLDIVLAAASIALLGLSLLKHRG